MKRFLFFAFACFTFYWASRYRSLALLFLCLAELLLLLLLPILPRLLKRKLSVRFPAKEDVAVAGSAKPFRVTVRSDGRLPVGRVRVRLRIWYERSDKGLEKKVYGGASAGENDLPFELLPQYCGMLCVRADRIRVYDYLSLFSSSKRVDAAMRIAVFPREQALKISFSGVGQEHIGEQDRPTRAARGETSSEVRRIREYIPGDRLRHIHWNQSARTDRLWVKEFAPEPDRQVDVLLDLRREKPADAKAWSDFYRLLSALVYGLLREEASVTVRWKPDGASVPLQRQVSDPGACRELLLALYGASFSQEEWWDPSDRTALRLTGELALYAGGKPLCGFHADKLDEELREQTLLLA